MGKRRKPVLVAVGVGVVGSAFLSGCVAKEPARDTAPVAAADASAPATSAAPTKWPSGADANTPLCQDASASVLSAVNASLHESSVADGTVETVLPWLTARPDPDLGMWTLTGLASNSETAKGTEGGYFVVFATKADPRSPTFDGALSTLGAAAGISTLPPLQPAYVGESDMDDVPSRALECGRQRADGS